MAKVQKPNETVEREFELFGKSNPALIQTLGKLSEIGARLNTDLANTLATLAYVQKAKGKLSEKVKGYETVLQSLLDLSANLSSHGVCMSRVMLYIISHASEIQEGYSRSNKSFEKYLCDLQVQSNMDKESL